MLLKAGDFDGSRDISIPPKPLVGFRDTRGRLKVLLVISMSTSKAEIISKNQIQWSSISEYEDTCLLIVPTMSL